MERTSSLDPREYVSNAYRDFPAPYVICLFSVRLYRLEPRVSPRRNFQLVHEFPRTRRKAAREEKEKLSSAARRLDTINGRLSFSFSTRFAVATCP